MLKEPSFGYLMFRPRKAHKCTDIKNKQNKKLGLKGKSFGFKNHYLQESVDS